MSAKSRYRAAHLAMWASWTLFYALVVYSVAEGAIRLSREPLFATAFYILLALIPLQIFLAIRAYKTVHCGKCKHRYFDRMFILFPIRKGCAKCDAPIEHAFVLSKEG